MKEVSMMLFKKAWRTISRIHICDYIDVLMRKMCQFSVLEIERVVEAIAVF
jgi:hypothetical protein